MQITEVLTNDFSEEILSLHMENITLHQKERPDYYTPQKDPKAILQDFMKWKRMFILEDNDKKIIGLVIFQEKDQQKGILRINEIVIHHEYRHLWYGKLLINFVKDRWKRNNYKKLELNCWSFNKDAQQTYYHLGMNIQRMIFECNI